MSISYPNLPGIEVTLKDGGLILPEDAGTESLLIIGPTTKVVGPDLAAGNVPENPVLIRVKEDLVAANISALNSEFVEGGKVNELAASWKAAYEGGCRRIYVLGVNATGATEDEKYKNFFLGVHKNLFGILEDFSVDNVVIVGGFADKKTTQLESTDFPDVEFSSVLGLETEIVGEVTTKYGNFAQALADYAEKQTLNLNTVVGYVGTSAPANNGLAAVKTKVDALVAEKKQYSGHVSVIAGPELGYQVPGLRDLDYRNGVVTYAALVCTLRAESAPTNKPVYGVSGIHYNMSLRQLDAISGSQYVSFRLKNGQVHVTDGITTAPDQKIGNVTYKSDYIRLSTLRITHAAVRLVREISDPFVGEPNGMPQRNALSAAIRGGLEAMKAAGAISDYRFSLTASSRQRILGQAVVTLELVPAFELRKITVDVSLRAVLDNQAE